ncbi:hypothetical protein [Bradyrhizobium diazoefficiens]|uniref:Uncharacterized protein n=1 Tax=Bradyrhizobium diazoefficiens TaxID=1355477 RepID=A0A809WSH3_9BRAD|nr:hypothetical protein XF1B_04260 [Bradyrhizobium diazoefficiens]BCF22473.1 hypothetical protein XF14B_04250 [Bradyrhizobium diazoefficiens]
MKALALDPIRQTVAVADVGRDAICSHAEVAVRFPNGDILLASRPTQKESTEAFTLGGSKPIVGGGMVVGRRLRAGEHAPPRTSLDDITTMVRWTRVEKKIVPIAPERPAEVRVVIIDPEKRSIEETRMSATVPMLESTIGAPPLLYLRIRGHHLYGSSLAPDKASWWRKEDFDFPGRVVVVGVDEHCTYMLDASIDVAMLKNTVTFLGSEGR